MKRLLILTSYFLLILTSCTFKESELFGFYSPINYKNTFDTIQIQQQNIYHRKVYDRNRNLVLEMDGKWRLERNVELHFESYFFNLDRDLAKYPELLQDTVGGRGGIVERQNGTLQFCVGYYEGENCYRKIKMK